MNSPSRTSSAHADTLRLTLWIVSGLVAGAFVGQFLFWYYGEATPVVYLQAFEFVGNTFFMNLLKMTLVPLVATSVIVGVSSIGDPTKLGKIGAATLVYYFATMVMAVVLGILLVTTIQPGKDIDQAFREAEQARFEASDSSQRERVESARGAGLWVAARNIAEQMIPTNPVGAAASGQLLPVITSSLLLGVVLTVIGDAGRPVLDFCQSLFTAVMQLVAWILWLAPLGVFALMALSVARIGFAALRGPLFYYVLTVLAGLAIHGFIVLPLVLFVFGRTQPFRYLSQMRAPLLTALGTDSSTATLPVTIETAETVGGCSQRAARFVLPLGATINMDGTALYEAVAVVFLFQCYGIPLGAVELTIIVITATLAAVGAAGIPSAGLFTMVIVVEAVNASLGDKHLPLSAVGLILGIDRLLDMCRTVVNVWGDAVGAKIISRLAPDE
jgi:Na+/H+-dicarboxylate symporter